jgi:exosortase
LLRQRDRLTSRTLAFAATKSRAVHDFFVLRGSLCDAKAQRMAGPGMAQSLHLGIAQNPLDWRWCFMIAERTLNFVRDLRPDSMPTSGNASEPSAAAKQVDARQARAQCLTAAAILAPMAVWCYLPTIARLVDAWSREPDYSHGFFVAPLAILFLWARRDRYPAQGNRYRAWGWLLIAAGLAMRWLSGRYYLEALDGWSIAVWLGGVVGVLAGWRVFLWTIPALAFLLMAVPLPFGAERAFSLPLQRVATELSCGILQMIGEPALAMGNTIVLGDLQLEVEQACSGLRIFVGIAALAYVYIVLVRRPWWEKCILMIAVAPIAVIANAVRIVITAVLYLHVSVEAGKKFTHDAAGWAMILLAAALFGLALRYLKWLVRDYQVASVGDLLQRDAANCGPMFRR